MDFTREQRLSGTVLIVIELIFNILIIRGMPLLGSFLSGSLVSITPLLVMCYGSGSAVMAEILSGMNLVLTGFLYFLAVVVVLLFFTACLYMVTP